MHWKRSRKSLAKYKKNVRWHIPRLRRKAHFRVSVTPVYVLGRRVSGNASRSDILRVRKEQPFGGHFQKVSIV
jgi:hypothetical protein